MGGAFGAHRVESAAHASTSVEVMGHLLRRWLIEDDAQDLVEYVLLTSVVGLAGLLAIAAFDDVISAVYASWDFATQAIWEPQDPQ
jgi:hypothetical protein